MRPGLLCPSFKEMTPLVVRSFLRLVGSDVPTAEIEKWSPLERALAYDWAYRVHLKASDNIIKLREKPTFVTAAERHEPDPATGPGVMLAFLKSRGELGANPTAIGAYLHTAGFDVLRETLQRWLASAQQDGLVKPDLGRWKAVAP